MDMCTSEKKINEILKKHDKINRKAELAIWNAEQLLKRLSRRNKK